MRLGGREHRWTGKSAVRENRLERDQLDSTYGASQAKPGGARTGGGCVRKLPATTSRPGSLVAAQPGANNQRGLAMANMPFDSAHFKIIGPGRDR
jgi:hypothetical protein